MQIITDNTAIELSRQGILPMPEYPYIATPYSYKGLGAERKMLERYTAATLISAVLFKNSIPHHGPIVATHPPSVILKNSADSSFWTRLDETVLKRCDGLWIFMLPEWASSTGIKKEIKMFFDLLQDIEYGIHDDDPKYKLPIRFYPMSAIDKNTMTFDIHNFQIMAEHKPLIKDLAIARNASEVKRMIS